MPKAGAGTASLLGLLLATRGFAMQWQYSTRPCSASSVAQQDRHMINAQTLKIIKLKDPQKPSGKL